MTDSADWGLVKLGEGIAGVHSLSEAPTLKRADFPTHYKDFEAAKTYDQWRFVFKAVTRLPPRPAAPSRRESPNRSDTRT